MSLFFLDSAALADVRLAASSRLISGVTTNPTILQRAAPGTPPMSHLMYLFEAFPVGLIFYQVHAQDARSASEQVDGLIQQLGDEAHRLVLKLPAQPEWFYLGANLSQQGRRVAFTAVYHPGQMLAAAQAGASYVIPYVDRARRLRPEAVDVVRQLSRFTTSDSPRILAASIKSGDQALAAFADGAHAVTADWAVIEELMSDELTDSAVEQFRTVVPL